MLVILSISLQVIAVTCTVLAGDKCLEDYDPCVCNEGGLGLVIYCDHVTPSQVQAVFNRTSLVRDLHQIIFTLLPENSNPCIRQHSHHSPKPAERQAVRIAISKLPHKFELLPTDYRPRRIPLVERLYTTDLHPKLRFREVLILHGEVSIINGISLFWPISLASLT